MMSKIRSTARPTQQVTNSPPPPARPPAPIDRERTLRELAALESLQARRRTKAPMPRVKVAATADGVALSTDHENHAVGLALLANALGTTDNAFLLGLLSQLGNASGSPGKKHDEDGLNFMLEAIRGVAPQDQTEAMLAAQMAAVHMATMTFARRLAYVDNIQQQDSAVGGFNKLARTFAAQVEALKRYRTGGEQRVVVQHVHVGEGGQAAVVGAVTTGGGGGGRGKAA